MKSIKRPIRFAAATILLILIIVFCTVETVKSQGNEDRAIQNKYYAALEKEYKAALCLELDRQGYHNSGITVRRITGEDGTRYYTVMIHHNRINDLNEKEISELLKILSEAEFEDALCSFSYEFITV